MGQILQSGAAVPVAAVLAALLWISPVAAQDADVSGDADATAAEPTAETTDDDTTGDESSGEGQEEAPEDVELRDRSEIGPGKRISGSIDVMANWTDNFFYNPENKQSAVGWFIIPHVAYGVASPRFRSNTSAGASIGFFSLGGTVDDYQDLNAATNASWTLAPAHRLGYDIALRKGHDPFGLLRTENDGTFARSLDRWVDEKYTLRYRIGQPRSSLSVENRLSVYNKTYHSNREIQQGFGTELLDHDIESFETTALYHYSPKTHAQLNFVASQVNFDKDFPGAVPSRDAQEYRLRAGLRWIATAKTSGDFRVGYFVRRFDEGLRQHSKFDWVVGVDWSPIKRTSVLVQTGRQSVESYNESLFIDVTYARVTWKQEWIPRLTTQAMLGYSHADFVNARPSRQDQSFNFSVRADYRLLKKLSVYGGYELDNRASDLDFFEYDKNTIYVGVRAFY
jgi:opacity protein-like surface antigen